MKVGYARVSSVDQNIDRQTDLMTALKVEKVFVDKMSGATSDRPGLRDLLSFVRDGDEVIVESISRLARSTKDLLEIIEQISKKGASFTSTKESLDTKTPQGRFVLTLFGALAELERESIHQRQSEGIAAARSRGTHLGRPHIKVPDSWPTIYAKWKQGKIRAVDAFAQLGLSKASFYKLAKKQESLS